MDPIEFAINDLAWSDRADHRKIAREARRAYDDLVAALESIERHAFDPETPRQDIEADFQAMRDIATTALTKAKGQTDES